MRHSKWQLDWRTEQRAEWTARKRSGTAILCLFVAAYSSAGFAAEPSSATKSGGDRCSFAKGVECLADFQPTEAIGNFTRAYLKSKPDAKVYRAKVMLEIARAFEADENDIAALGAMRIANALHPNDPTTVAYLVEILLRCGYADQAKPQIEWLKSQKDRSRAVIEVLAGVAMRAYDAPAAKTLLENELKQPSAKQDTHLLLMYARVLSKMGLSSEARNQFKAASDSSTSEYLKNMAATLVQKIDGKPDVQKKFILAAGKILPNDPMWHTELGDFYNSEGKQQSAFEQYNLSLQNRASTRSFERMISYLQKQKRYDAALKVAVDLTKLKPRSFESYQRLGNVYLAKKDFDDAAENFKKALELDKHIDSLYSDLARNYLEQKDRKQAHDILIAGLAACPNSMNLMKRLARSEKADRNEAEARKYFSQIIEFTSNNLKDANVLVRHDAGWAHANIGCYDYAEQNYDQALENAQKFNELKFVPTLPPLLSMLRLRPSRIEIGTTAAEQEYAHHIMLADMLREGGNLDGCIAEYRKAENLNSDDPDLHTYLLSALDEKGDWIGAAKEDLALSSKLVNRVPAELKHMIEKKAAPPTAASPTSTPSEDAAAQPKLPPRN